MLETGSTSIVRPAGLHVYNLVIYRIVFYYPAGAGYSAGYPAIYVVVTDDN